jgi:hypothetical protein
VVKKNKYRRLYSSINMINNIYSPTKVKHHLTYFNNIFWFVTRLTERVSLVEQELLTIPEHLSSPRVLVGSCFSIISFICMSCRSLFVLLYLLYWPLCCLFIFDLRLVPTKWLWKYIILSPFLFCVKMASYRQL